MRTNKRLEKYESMRNKMFPELMGSGVYWVYTDGEGWRNLPRLMVHILNAMDSMCTGEPPSKVYLALWMRAFDTFYLPDVNLDQLAFESNLSGQRAVSTLRKKLKHLKDLGFIREKNDFQYIAVPDPVKVLENLIATGKFRDQKLLNALVARSGEVGHDLPFGINAIEQASVALGKV